jgi:hypothetical protein
MPTRQSTRTQYALGMGDGHIQPDDNLIARNVGFDRRLEDEVQLSRRIVATDWYETAVHLADVEVDLLSLTILLGKRCCCISHLWHRVDQVLWSVKSATQRLKINLKQDCILFVSWLRYL